MKLSHVLFRRCLLSAVFTLSALSAFAQTDPVDTRPVVHLELIDPDAAETLPFQNAIFWGEFRVVRSGDPTNELTVFFGTEGSAILGQDYRLDRMTNGASLTFRAGQSAINVRLYPIDDELKEGDENALIRLAPPPYAGPLPDPYRIDPERSSVEIVIHDNDPVIPIISIRTPRTPETTAEPCPTCLVAPGVIRVTRVGSIAEPLTVSLTTDGTASAGADYRALPETVTFPAGSNAVHVLVLPFDDRLVEGPEVVRTRVAPPANPSDYIVARENEALVVIRDDEPEAPDARLDIVEPLAGAQFPTGTAIQLSAISVYLGGEVSRPVEFYSGDQFIGQSEPGPLRPPIAGLPNVHTLLWTNPPPGAHSITARVQLSLTRWLASPPVQLVVGSEPPLPLVSIVASQPIAEESSYPLRRLPLRGEFTISRTGATNTALSVFVLYSGTATPDVDYPAQPWLATIPEGATSTRITIEPKDDGVPEGVETVVARLSHCPPDPLDIPCYGGFDIDPRRAQAIVSIRDNALTEATLTITNPKAGATFPVGETILIEATAIDPEGYIPRVEFFDGDRSIGVSEIVFVREPDPGTPIHHRLEWRGATAGGHTLTARALRANGTRVSSSPVNIMVGGGGQAPRIAIIQPLNGAQFPADAAIEIVAEAVDPDGYVPRVEFFADARKIGEVNLQFIRPPDPGEAQKFSFTWRYALPGRHVLTAVATDDSRNRSISAPVGIYVGTTNLLPIVNVEAPDPYAVEPQSNTVLNTATFRIRRHGPTNDPLVVAYSLLGTAENGIDYERLPGLATIPAGSRGVAIIVRPLSDNLREGTESVRLQLEEPPPSTDTTRVINPYQVGRIATAGAVISDYPLITRCRWFDNLMLVCFPADTGGNFRIEATSDFRTWETLCDGLSGDSALHFIDTDAERHATRFYRLTPEPVLQAAE